MLKVQDLNVERLEKILWREKVGTTLTQLPLDFYHQLKRVLQLFKTDATMKEYKKAYELAQSLINCRMKKIVDAACRGETPPNLTGDELLVFDDLATRIRDWKSTLLSL